MPQTTGGSVKLSEHRAAVCRAHIVLKTVPVSHHLIR